MIAYTTEQKWINTPTELCSETSCQNIGIVERRLQITGTNFVTGKRHVYQTSMVVCKDHSSKRHKVTP